MSRNSPILLSQVRRDSPEKGESPDNPSPNGQTDDNEFMHACANGISSLIQKHLYGKTVVKNWPEGFLHSCEFGELDAIQIFLTWMDTLGPERQDEIQSIKDRALLISAGLVSKPAHQGNQDLLARMTLVVERLLDYGAGNDHVLREQALSDSMAAPEINALIKGSTYRKAHKKGQRTLDYLRSFQYQFEHGWNKKSKAKGALLKQILDQIETQYISRPRRTIITIPIPVTHPVTHQQELMSVLDVLRLNRYKAPTPGWDGRPRFPHSFEVMSRNILPTELRSEAIRFLEAEYERILKNQKSSSKARRILDLIETLKAGSAESINTLENLCLLTAKSSKSSTAPGTEPLLRVLRTHRNANDIHKPKKEPRSFTNFCKLFAVREFLSPEEIDYIAPPTYGMG